MVVRLNSNGNPFVNEYPNEDDINDTIDYLEKASIPDAELAVRILQSNNVFINGPNLVVDEAIDSNGTNNTIDKTNDGAVHDASNSAYVLAPVDDASGDTTHDPDAFSSPTNAFDDNDGTFATKNRNTSGSSNSNLGKTFGAKTVKSVRAVYSCTTTSVANQTVTIKIQTYNGSVWSDFTTLDTLVFNNSTPPGIKYSGANIDASVQGVRIRFENAHSGTSSINNDVYSLEYGDTYQSSSTIIINANTTILDGNEKAFVVSTPDSSFPTNTSISVVVSDGTNSLTSATIDSISKGVIVANTGGLTSGTLNLTFTLASTDNTVTPTLSTYGVKILR